MATPTARATAPAAAARISNPVTGDQPASASGSAAAVTAAVAWDPQSLQAFEARLAASIGPVARVLVAKATRTACSWQALVAAVAHNLPDPAEQAAFRSEFERP